jgi:hypothetical protein
MKHKEYSAGTVKMSFWFMEFRKIVQMRAEGKSMDATFVRLGRYYKTMLYEAGVIDKVKEAKKVERRLRNAKDFVRRSCRGSLSLSIKER